MVLGWQAIAATPAAARAAARKNSLRPSTLLLSFIPCLLAKIALQVSDASSSHTCLAGNCRQTDGWPGDGSAIPPCHTRLVNFSDLTIEGYPSNMIE
jgi:hypothetical protein